LEMENLLSTMILGRTAQQGAAADRNRDAA